MRAKGAKLKRGEYAPVYCNFFFDRIPLQYTVNYFSVARIDEVVQSIFPLIHQSIIKL